MEEKTDLNEVINTPTNLYKILVFLQLQMNCMIILFSRKIKFPKSRMRKLCATYFLIAIHWGPMKNQKLCQQLC